MIEGKQVRGGDPKVAACPRTTADDAPHDPPSRGHGTLARRRYVFGCEELEYGDHLPTSRRRVEKHRFDAP
jgi:hypothetical protein